MGQVPVDDVGAGEEREKGREAREKTPAKREREWNGWAGDGAAHGLDESA